MPMEVMLYVVREKGELFTFKFYLNLLPKAFPLFPLKPLPPNKGLWGFPKTFTH